LEGTRLLETHCRATGIKAVTARLFTVYGPGENPCRLLPSLIRAAQARVAVPLTSGSQQRDFTYVEDVADGLLRLGVAPAQPGDVVNLATGRLTAVCDFARLAAGMLGIPPDHLCFGRIHVRFPEMKHDAIDLRRLQKLTGWTPPTVLDEGIRKTAMFPNVHEMEAAK
jgi:nucleoside-diphosphate-sugar epimerase